MLSVYVVWSVDGPIMTTLLQYDESEREVVESWTPDQFVEQAKDVEDVDQSATYELAGIFSADNLRFIY